MNTVNRYRVEYAENQSKVASVSPHAPGYEDHPDVIVYGYVLTELTPPMAEAVVGALNSAFNAGREFARQR